MHLSRRQWGHLWQEIIASNSAIVALKEVFFRSGNAHMAYTSRACPNSVPLAHSDQSPDTIFLVHENCHYHLLPEHHTHAIAMRVKMLNSMW